MAGISAFETLVQEMPILLADLKRCELFPVSPRTNFPKLPSIYALYEDSCPIYVGRTKNLRQRIGHHIGGNPEQSSFAVKLAREATGYKATYRPQDSRKSLMKNQGFQLAFKKFVSRICQLDGRYVVIESEIKQHMFELYAALVLDTQYNQFGTS